jgi:hypothetical protein
MSPDSPAIVTLFHPCFLATSATGIRFGSCAKLLVTNSSARTLLPGATQQCAKRKISILHMPSINECWVMKSRNMDCAEAATRSRGIRLCLPIRPFR